MISIAITGSFSSGKSFVLDYIKSMGYHTFSCDEYVKDLYKNLDMQDLVVKTIDKLENFDKKNIIKIISEDEVSRRKLEKLIHPLVRQGIKDFKEKYSQEEKIFFEVPLLFETGFEKDFNYSICVFCSEETRLKRAELRGNFNSELFYKIKKIQLSPDKKIEKANFNVNTDLKVVELKKLIVEIIEKII